MQIIPRFICTLSSLLILPHSAHMKRNTPNASKQQSITPEYVSVDQAEVISGLSRWRWRRYAYRGKIASVKEGRRLLIPISEIRRIMSEGYRPALEGQVRQ